jgi:hypothetical protein
MSVLVNDEDSINRMPGALHLRESAHQRTAIYILKTSDALPVFHIPVGDYGALKLFLDLRQPVHL